MLKEVLMAMPDDLAAFLPALYFIPSLKGAGPMEAPPRLFDGTLTFFMLILMSPMLERAPDIEPTNLP